MGDRQLTEKSDQVARISMHFLRLEDQAGIRGRVGADFDDELLSLSTGGCKLRVESA